MKQIRIGIGVVDSGGTPLKKLLARLRSAEEAGFQSAWIPNVFAMDAMTLAALAGAETRRIEIGTAVVPTFSRHPFYMAQQALSTQAALGGRFVLGIGPSHKLVVEDMLGLSYERPARHVREYASVLRELFDTGRSSFQGETLQVKGSLDVAAGPPPPLLIGALGPLMRKVAGTLAEGTITWMTGPRTLGQEVAPGVRAAAEAAGRPAPRVVAGIPTVLTDDPRGAREGISKQIAVYGTLPSYRAMLDLEGVSQPGDIALVGDEKALEEGILRFADAGATDFHAAIMPHGADARASMQRTTQLLAELARS